MKPKKKQKILRITEADFMLANRRAARLEEIAEHGRPVSMRTVLHKSKKVYDRKRQKKAGIESDDLPFLSAGSALRTIFYGRVVNSTVYSYFYKKITSLYK